MRITQLKQVLAIQKYGSISKAAQELYVSQPSLSATLHSLEQELGVTIFQRTSKGVVPTPEGQIIIQEAWNVVESVERIQNISEAHLQQEIKIAYGPYFDFMIPGIVAEFQKRWPDISMNFCYPKKMQLVLDNMNKGHYRLCMANVSKDFLADVEDIGKFRYITLFPEVTSCAFLHKEHPLAQKKALSAEDFEEYSLVMAHTSMSEFFFEVYPELKNVCQLFTGDLSIAMEILREKLGVTVMNATEESIAAMQRKYPNLAVLPYQNKQNYKIEAVLITARPELLTKAEQDFVDIVCEQAKNYREKHCPEETLR